MVPNPKPRMSPRSSQATMETLVSAGGGDFMETFDQDFMTQHRPQAGDISMDTSASPPKKGQSSFNSPEKPGKLKSHLQEDMEKPRVTIPRIYYATRTHSQIAQVLAAFPVDRATRSCRSSFCIRTHPVSQGPCITTRFASNLAVTSCQ
jgi:hypothetical protein